VSIDASLVRAAIATARQFQLSYWDALIIEAAVASGCATLLSEDLQAGAVIHGVEIVNPFA
jgi:predicted nucleic acid-binding protein